MAQPEAQTSTEPEPEVKPFAPQILDTTARLSLPFPLRLTGFLTASGIAGFFLGTIHGSNESGLRFRAENAHRLPHSQTGWYLYHKSKNYHVALGGIKEGFKMAGRLSVLMGVFVVGEEFVDRGRGAVVRTWRDVRGRNGIRELRELEDETPAGNRDFVSTLLAGVGTGGAYAVWHGFQLPTAVRLMKMGAKVGLVYGVMQDAVGLLRGRRLGYVEFIKRHTFGASEVGVELRSAAPG